MKTVVKTNLTPARRPLPLQGLFLAGIVGLLLAWGWLERRIEQQVVFPNFENQVMNGRQETLKSPVDSEVQGLALRLQPAKPREEPIATLQAETMKRWVTDLAALAGGRRRDGETAITTPAPNLTSGQTPRVTPVNLKPARLQFVAANQNQAAITPEYY